MSKALVVGGAGYIGSHMVKMLLGEGHEVVTLDDLSGGYRDAVLGGAFVEGDLGDAALLDQLFSSHKFDGVMHFASFIMVGESVTAPGKYYENNLAKTVTLLNALVRHEVKAFIFSSTAAIYGNPRYVPIDEEHEAAPINPYGRTKWMVEQILQDFDHAHELRSACLRYFNAAGADPDGELGERHELENHLIPLVLRTASGKRDSITVFGRDYDTPDGTCIRDYIHITDLCQAHLRALQQLWEGAGSAAYNLGNGKGYSVLEVIETACEGTGLDIAVVEGSRRPGDAEKLIADSSKAKASLGWEPKYPELSTIIEHSWNWEMR